MLERIKNFFLYGDTDKESYKSVKANIERYNAVTALIFASVATLLIGVMYFLADSKEGFASSKHIYHWGMVLSVFELGIAVAARKIRIFSYIAVYLAIAIFLSYGIAIATISRPEEQTVTFMVMLIFVPLIFIDRPIRMALVLILYIAVFIILAYRTKIEPVLSVDVTDAYIFGMLSIVSESVVYRAKIRGYVLEHKLKAMSETDQLTGLNNRNCYEMSLGSYPNRFKDSICCIYIDVNGLHELNNTKGHQAGDEMLQYIADIVKKTFGQRDSYRIGGDEYVTFVTDRSLSEVEAKLSEMKERIAEKSYHAAIGYEFCDTKNVNMNDLIVVAESKMYKDKSEYYKTHDRRTRQ